MSVLVVYSHRFSWPLRRTVTDHLSMFEEASRPLNIAYLNTAFGVPRYLRAGRFDLLVLHPTWLAAARHPLLSEDHLFATSGCFRAIARRRIALPQDEHHNTRRLKRIFLRLGIQDVFSVASAECRQRLYEDLDPAIRLHTIPTGGISSSTLAAIETILHDRPPRTIDIGYRATAPSPRLGSHGRLKGEIAVMVERAARAHGLTTDISLHPDDTFLDLDWYRFLARCRYTIGVEGGSSVPDMDGEVARDVRRFLTEEPGADFQRVAGCCFPGLDGTLDYRALSPRQLEAVATRTGQILISGDYGGLLRAGEHYLELAADFSNLDRVLEQVRDEDRRQEMTSASWAELVGEQRLQCGSLADAILAALPGLPAAGTRPGHRHLRKREAVLEQVIPPEAFLYQWGQRFLPGKIVARLRQWYRKSRNR